MSKTKLSIYNKQLSSEGEIKSANLESSSLKVCGLYVMNLVNMKLYQLMDWKKTTSYPIDLPLEQKSSMGTKEGRHSSTNLTLIQGWKDV